VQRQRIPEGVRERERCEVKIKEDGDDEEKYLVLPLYLCFHAFLKFESLILNLFYF
jgi:hypothetical protein